MLAVTWQHLSKEHLCYRMCSVSHSHPGFHVYDFSHPDTSSNEALQRHIHTSFFALQHCQAHHNKAISLLLLIHELVPSPSQVRTALELFGQLQTKSIHAML